MSEKQVTKSSANLAGLERWLDEMINKKQPLQLPAGAREWLASNVWWLAIIGGVLSLWGAWSFWNVGNYLNGLDRVANEVARTYGVTTYANDLGPMWYVALIGLVVEGVLLLVAAPKLKAMQKSGWNLLFYASLVSVAVGLVYLLVPNYGFGSLFGTLLGAAIGWFFLFQMRSRFMTAMRS